MMTSRLGHHLVNSADAFKALVAATSAMIAIARYRYVIFSPFNNPHQHLREGEDKCIGCNVP